VAFLVEAFGFTEHVVRRNEDGSIRGPSFATATGS
jgi:hypothetical protein